MLLMITSKCNMRCAHCGFSCIDNGEDMSLETFRKAISIANNCNSDVCLSGGEPTIHPLFEQFLLEAIIACKVDKPYIVTNGKETNRAIMIAQLAKNNIIDGRLSQDIYHEPIDSKVIKMFEEIDAVGTISYPSKTGRAKNLELNEFDNNCFCADIVIKPNGNIYQCGCENATMLGNVNGAYDIVVTKKCCHYKDKIEKKELICV